MKITPARRNYNGAKARLKQSVTFMSADRYRKMKPSMRFYWFQIVRVLGFAHMGNRAAVAGGLSCVHIETNPGYIHNPHRETGSKNIMRDKRVKAYSNSRPRVANIHIDRSSPQSASPLCLDPFTKAFNRFNGSMANLVSCPIAELGKLITVFIERTPRFLLSVLWIDFR